MASNSKLYEVIVNYLEKQIADGVYDNQVQLPTEVILGEMFNVSRITSKRALDELKRKGLIYRKQGRGSYVIEKDNSNEAFCSQETQEQTKVTVALVLPYDSLGGRFSEIVQGASAVLEKNGYRLSLHNSGSNIQNEREILTHLADDGTKGIIFYPKYDLANIDFLYDLWLKKYPLVIIDKKMTDIPVCSIYSDHYTGAYNLTQELIDNGHTKIACFYYLNMSEVFSIRQRYFGYCTALHDNGIPLNPSFIINNYDELSTKHEKKREAILNELLEMGVTAICAQNDYAALDIIALCNHNGIEIPEKLSVVGFDNVMQSEYSNPALTTAKQNFSALGQSAAKAVLAQVNRQPYETEQIIPVMIVKRNSIKKMTSL